MSLKIPSFVVSVDWLLEHLENESLLILDATIPKVGSKKIEILEEKSQIKKAHFFDLKDFSDAEAPLPNTMLTGEKFQQKAKQFGINNNHCIVVYDDLGIYSSPRVWWMFQLMGFENIAVLDGGFPEWKAKKYPIEKFSHKTLSKGNFTANYHFEKITFMTDVLANVSSKKYLVLDARSEGRFFGTEPEPRKEVRGGHIPNSKSLPHTDILDGTKMKPTDELKMIFETKNPENKPLIFSCGSGITASILALGATIAGIKNHSVYDGSWTEWGLSNAPINS
ncbi:MAG: sulfurtransferase [Polaribacter sp.]|jgi:thiosulfate/3-mercaptopyruvate sulfurtransferase|nr:sulfurtransferase [Polaribacter sp.]MDP4704245.1 sulfurtransferase [Polaribacter sp.]